MYVIILTCKACDIVPDVLLCTPMVAKASRAYFCGLGTMKLGLLILDSLVATKPGMLL